MRAALLVLGLMAIALILTPTAVPQLQGVSRSIELVDSGLIYVTDSVSPQTPQAEIRIGFTEDMADKLLGYYVSGAEASISLERGDNGALYFILKPVNSWPSGTSASLVTVWRDMLLKTEEANKYRLIMSLTPLMEERISELRLSMKVPEGATITAANGAEFKLDEEKTTATATLRDILPNQVKAGSITIDIGDMKLLTIERAEVSIDLQGEPQANLYIKVRNDGERTINDVDIFFPSGASLKRVTNGIEPLQTQLNEKAERLRVILKQPLRSGERAGIYIQFQYSGLVDVLQDRIVVHPPKLLNATIVDYFITVITPPGDVKAITGEEWALKPLYQDRKEITVKLSNLVILPNTSILLSFKPAAIPSALTPAIWAGIILAAAVTAVVRKMKTPSKVAYRMSGEVKNTLQEIVSIVQETLTSYQRLVENIRPDSSSFGSSQRALFEEKISSVRRARDRVMEMRRRVEKAVPDAIGAVKSIESAFDDIITTLQALQRSYDDARSGRLTKHVYERVFSSYRKALKSSESSVRDAIAILRSQLR
ncbi:MAG: hypothetical protein NXY59_05770 [Aigarchaeota archaeon]|nr:hypothetical protein [Candidatus Pelearchaeum maunauluense]